MTNQKTTGSNGTATAPKENGKAIATVTPLTVVSKSIEQPVAKSSSLEERVNRINQLVDLQKKYNRLLESEQKLAEFKMKKGAENIEFSIEDDTTRSMFSTKNPDLIAEVLETVRLTIQKRKKEIEPLLTW